MALFNFNPAEHKLQTNLEPLPAGWYPAVMIESEIVPTEKKNGFRLAVMFEIIEGPGKGRKQPASYNIDNPSAKAVEISMEEIKTMQFCMKIFAPVQDSQEYHNKPLQIRLARQKDSDYCEIKGYKTIEGEDASKLTPGASALPPMGHQQQPAQGFGQPPAPYAVPAAPAAPQYPVSPDGAFMWVNGAWAPNTQTAPAPPPPPPPPAAPVNAAPPAWAPPAMPPPPAQTAPPAYAPQASQAPPAAPPAWAPQSAPAAPSWAPQS